MKAVPVIVMFVAAAGCASPADRPQGLMPQIDRIFAADEYAAPRFGPARWLPGGVGYAIVEHSATGAEIVQYDAATGARSVMVAAARLMPPGAASGLDIDDYAWSNDAKRLIIFTNTRKVWRDNTRGDYWVLDLEGGQLRKLGGDAPEAALMFAKFSPDALRVAYVRANNIYVERLDDGSITPITRDGSQTTINGTSDWVYEEELGVRDAFRWSPDGRQIAYWQFDTTGVGVFSLINNTDTLYPIVTSIPYPKAGTTNSAARIGVVSAEGGETRWMRTPRDPRDSYLASLTWSDADTLAIGQLNRLQNQHDLLLADARTGEVRRVFRDESKTWVDLGVAREIDGGKAYLRESERDGWRHIYRVLSEGGDATLLTRFDADVIDGNIGANEAQGLLYFSASPHNATQAYLYRSRLDGTGKPERVTPTDQPGWHEYTLAPGGRMAFHTWSRFDQPNSLEVVTLPDHEALRQLTDATALKTKLMGVLEPPVEFFKVGIGADVSLDGWMLKPSTFDASKRYPMIVFVYGEPASVTVTDRWGGGRMLFHRAMAEAGYLVVSFDNRGTPAPKGAAWRKVVYGSVGDLSSKEQADPSNGCRTQAGLLPFERVRLSGLLSV